MALNLIDLTKDYLTPDVLLKITGLVGESPANTQKAMDAIFPSLVGVACNESSSPGGSAKLLRLLETSGVDLSPSSFASALSGGSATDGLLKTGSNLLNGLLGDKLGQVVSVIASFSGVQFSSASKLLTVAAPVLLGLLAKQMASGRLTAASLPALLSSHRDTIMQFAPPGLAGALGLGSNSKLCGAAPVPEIRPAAVPEERGAAPVPEIPPAAVREERGAPVPEIPPVAVPEVRGVEWWKWAVPLLALVAAFLGWRTCSSPRVEKPVASVPVVEKPVAPPAVPQTAAVTLPCGTAIAAEKGSFTSNLANFMLKDSDSELPKRFVFDHLNFYTATTRLTSDSNATVTDVIAIMKCYPNMQVRLEGDTDSTGNPAANRKLSVARADAIRVLLVQAGIDNSRLGTVGYGADKPIASNDTEEGRAENRRCELVVTKIK